MKLIEQTSQSSHGNTMVLKVFIDEKREDNDIIETSLLQLPEGWKTSKSRRSECLYYFNKKLGQTQWEPPQHRMMNIVAGKGNGKGHVDPAQNRSGHSIAEKDKTNKDTVTAKGYSKGSIISPNVLPALGIAFKGKGKHAMKGTDSNIPISTKGLGKKGTATIVPIRIKGFPVF